MFPPFWVQVKYRATQLRDLLTRLGPTFIKAGQVGPAAALRPACCSAGLQAAPALHRPLLAAKRMHPLGELCGSRRARVPAAIQCPAPTPSPPPLLQVLANRPDIVREDYMNELCVLQDDVPPFPDEQVRVCVKVWAAACAGLPPCLGWHRALGREGHWHPLPLPLMTKRHRRCCTLGACGR